MRTLTLARHTGLAVLALAGAVLQAQQMPARVRVVLPAYQTPIAIDTIIQARTKFDAPPGKVWAVAERVFYDLKVATDIRDSAGGIIGAKSLVKSSSLAGKPMSAWLNCGIDMTGPKADIYRITMALIAIVTPVSATQSELGVGFVGSGLDMRGSSANPVMCATSGRLEVNFVERAGKIIKAP